jgi:TRAP-type C4-dicarboxylate transport system substrate-binding protein
MMDEIEARSGGRWKIDTYWGEILSPKAKNIYGIRDGLFDTGFCETMGIWPAANFYTQSGYFAPTKRGADVTRFAFEAQEHPLVVQEMDSFNTRPFAYMCTGGRDIFTKDKPLHSCNDVDGLVIRDWMPEGKLWEGFGAVIVDQPWSDTMELASRGVIDAATGETMGSLAWMWEEQFNYVTDTIGLFGQPSVTSVVCSKDSWDALPDDLKDVWYDVREDLPQHYEELNAVIFGPHEERALAAGFEFVPWPIEETVRAVQYLKENRWPELLAIMEDRGYDADAFFEWVVELAEKYGKPDPR